MSIADRPAPGEARSPGISYQELLDTDTHEVPAEPREASPRYFGGDDIPVERYTSRAWHDKEVEHVWSRVWQFARREELLPDVGDYVVYEIARSSFVVIRTASFNRIVYRFRPNGDDHRSSIMEVLLLSPFSGERPAPAPVHWLGPDDSFTDAPELGMLGKIFNQDLSNMARVQQGLETSKKRGRHALGLHGVEGPLAPRQARRLDRGRRTRCRRQQRSCGRAVKGIVHPMTGALHEQDGEGTVRVAMEDDRVGIFTPSGHRVSGDKIDVDIHLAGWVGGPKVKHHRLER